MKLGVIGTGRIVWQMLEGAMKIDNVEINALYSRNIESEICHKMQDVFGFKFIFSDIDELLACSEVDTIYIATPNSLHFEQSKRALLAGKNVICEKPFTATGEQAEALITIAKEQNVFLFEGIPLMHTEILSSIKKDVEQLKEIKYVTASYAQYSSRYTELLEGTMTNIFNPQFAGGALMDINVYNIHFCVALFGKPDSVEYHANKYHDIIDTSGLVILKYPTFICSCYGAKDSHGVNLTQVQAENGSLSIPDGINGMTTYDLKIVDEQPRSVKIGEEGQRLFYELQSIANIIEQKDFKRCYELLEHSQIVSNVLTDARAFAKLGF